MKKTAFAVGLALAVSGCSTVSPTGTAYEPVIDPQSSQVSMGQYREDLRGCKAIANRRGGTGAGAAGGALTGGAVGAAMGAALGAIAGDPATGAAIGAAGAGTAGMAQGAASNNTKQKEIIARCMQNRGYDVLAK